MPKLRMYIQVQPREAKILERIHKEICPDMSMEPSDLFKYIMQWVNARMQEGILWVPPEPRRRWRDWELMVLGTRPDHIVAAMTGRSEYLIRQKRLDQKIPPFQGVDIESDQTAGGDDTENTGYSGTETVEADHPDITSDIPDD